MQGGCRSKWRTSSRGEAARRHVMVVMNGANRFSRSRSIPTSCRKEDVEMLQDLIVAAVNDAHRKPTRSGAEDGRHDGRPEDSRPLRAMEDIAMSSVHQSVTAVFDDVASRTLVRLIRAPAPAGVGPKGAQRLAFHILKTPREEAERLVDAVRRVKECVTYCSICSNITDVEPCAYCSSDERDHRIICVVEEPQNVAGRREDREFKGCITC